MSQVDYYRHIIHIRVINELKTIIDRFLKNKKSKISSENQNWTQNYSQSYFEGYILLAYSLLHLAFWKFEILQDEILEIEKRYTDENRGKGSLDLKIERKIHEWREAYLFTIRKILQKYSTGLLHLSKKDKISKIQSLIDGNPSSKF